MTIPPLPPYVREDDIDPQSDEEELEREYDRADYKFDLERGDL